MREIVDEVQDFFIGLVTCCIGTILFITAPVWVPIRLIVRKVREIRR